VSHPGARAGLWLAAAASAAVAAWSFRSLVALPPFHDDFAALTLIAEVRAGLRPGLDLLLLPHNEHTPVLLRALYWLASLAGDYQVATVRAALIAGHAAAAVAAGDLCHRWTAAPAARWLGTVLYAGSAGFCGLAIAAPMSGVFILGGAFHALALASLARPGPSRPRAGLSLTLAVLAGLSLNGGAVALPALPLVAGLTRDDPARSRRRLTVLYAALGAVILALAWWNLARQGGRSRLGGLGDPAGPAAVLGWLVYTAPLKLAATWAGLPLTSLRAIAAGGALAWAVTLVSLRGVERPLRRVLAALWLAPLALWALVALGRGHSSVVQLYLTDRYYYYALLPLVAQAVFLAVRRRWLPPLAVAAAVVLVLTGNQASLRAAVPREWFEPIVRSLDQGRLLVEGLDQAAARRPVVLGDGVIPLPGIRSPGASLAFLVYGARPAGIEGARIVATRLPDADAAVQNRLLDEWARRAGLPRSPVCVRDGVVRGAGPGTVLDFAHEVPAGIATGLHAWSSPYRWMGARATIRLRAVPGRDLRLRLFSPVDWIRRRQAGFPGLPLDVAIAGVPAGSLLIDQPGEQEVTVATPAAALLTGPDVAVTLSSRFTWSPRDYLSGNPDQRELSVGLVWMGFGDREAVEPAAGCTAPPGS
jgi:hypothetical protein